MGDVNDKRTSRWHTSERGAQAASIRLEGTPCVYLGASGNLITPSEAVRTVVEILDAAGVTVVTLWDIESGVAAASMHRVMAGCKGMIIVASCGDSSCGIAGIDVAIDIAHSLNLPCALAIDGVAPAPDHSGLQALLGPWTARVDDMIGCVPLRGVGKTTLASSPFEERLFAFVRETRRARTHRQPFAFIAVRIHDDFLRVREAIRSAVERVLGIPCIWFEDPRVFTSMNGVRERTQAMIREAELVIADVTYGPDNPDFDSPNTAHEIGMALAYERALILTCQYPRRDVYFSAGDLSILFWRDESHLHDKLVEWIHAYRGRIGRRVLNHDLCPAASGDAQRIKAPAFDPTVGRPYRAPSTRGSIIMRGLDGLSVGLVPASAAFLANRTMPAAVSLAITIVLIAAAAAWAVQGRSGERFVRRNPWIRWGGPLFALSLFLLGRFT